MKSSIAILAASILVAAPHHSGRSQEASNASIRHAASTPDFERKFNSRYSIILIRKTGSLVEMSHRADGYDIRESAIDLSNPLDLVVPYTRYLFGAAVVAPSPKRVLMVGLGGGGFHRLFTHAYPACELTTVEIDKDVLKLAERYMGFQETTSNRVVIEDGRVYMKRKEVERKFDWIVMDAFRGNYCPQHMKTAEFYHEAAHRLRPEGVFVMNLHANVVLYDYDIATLRHVFAQVALLQVPGEPNVVALCSPSRDADLEKKIRAATGVASSDVALWQNLDRASIIGSLHVEEAIEARILTDDYAPAEYLNVLKREMRRL